MIQFPSIEQFRHVVVNVKRRARYVGNDENGEPIFDPSRPTPTLDFRGTVKLHGTNTGVALYPDGRIQAQSRNRELTVVEDSYGFASFVKNDVPGEVWSKLFGALPTTDKPIVLFGEWAGSGVQKGVAISGLPEKMFFIFGVRVGEGEETTWVDIEPLKDSLCAHEHRIYNVFEFPTWKVQIDFGCPDDACAEMEKIVAQVENECPVGKYFGLSGVGEGVVFTCQTPGWMGSDFRFKVKGEKHKIAGPRGAKQKIEINPERMDSVRQFVKSVVSDNRCEQGIEYLKEQGKPLTIRSMGDFIKWVIGDILKEEYDSMEASNITKKEMSKAAGTFVREWYVRYIDSI